VAGSKNRSPAETATVNTSKTGDLNKRVDPCGDCGNNFGVEAVDFDNC